MTDEVVEDDWVVCSKKAKKPVINKSNFNNNNTGRGKNYDNAGRTYGSRALNKSHYSTQDISNRASSVNGDMSRNYHHRNHNKKINHLDNIRVDDTGYSVSSSCMDIDSIRTIDDIDTVSSSSYNESYTDMNTSPVNDDINRREYGNDDDDAVTSNYTDSVTTTSAATRHQYVKISLPHDDDNNNDKDNHHHQQTDSVDSLDFSVSTHDLSPAASTTSSSTSASSPMDTTATSTTTTTTDHDHHITKAPGKKILREEDFHTLMHYATTFMTDVPLSNAVYQPR